MAKANTVEKKTPLYRTECTGLVTLGIAFLFLISLFNFQIQDPSQNTLGLVGWGIAWGLTYLFGLCSYLLVPFFGWLGWQYLLNKRPINFLSKCVWFFLFLFSCSLLLTLCAELITSFDLLFENRIYSKSLFFNLPYPHRMTRYHLGGVPAYYLYRDLPGINLQRLLSDVGVGLTFSLTAIVSFLITFEVELLPFLASAKLKIAQFKPFTPNTSTPSLEPLNPIEEETHPSSPLFRPLYSPRKEKKEELKIHTMETPQKLEKKSVVESPSFPVKKREAALDAQRVANGDFTTYQIPPSSLLNPPKKVDQPSLKKELKKQAEILEETLLSFGIEAKVGEIHCGPTITSFEVHPAIGVKVQKIKALENDIALNLQAKSIRIIAPIPGKAAVGVEVPSLYPQEVSFKELLSYYQQSSRKMMIPLLLGKAVAGDQVVSDLSKMPHCLIAGATGAGKSVCINTIIMSILMNARPDEIKLIMIDPKKVELTPYTHLPHMIAPVITEAHGAYSALSWLVKEMQNRYDLLKQLGVRNISAFNHRQINHELEASLNIPVPARMNAIVAIIDEFADLMMASSSDLETPIARIAQMARAVGIHLILATQRPSREVITGLIKANFPTRLAFKVSSRINSQIILDDVGAESLLGNGDLLFLPPGTSSLIRAQGAYISDEEIQRVVEFICRQAPPRYLIESFDKIRFEDNLSLEGGEETPKDSLYEQAFSIVVETKTASTTYLQRKLKIGYARAASLIDELEANGVISPQEGGRRRILIDSRTAPKSGETDETQEIFT